MKKPIFGLITIITFSILFVFIFSNFAVSEDNPLTQRRKLTQRKPISKLSATTLIKQKMEQLGFQVGKITRSGGNYIIVVNSFTAKTKALRKKGGFKSFNLTAKVDKGQVILDNAELQKQGFVVRTRSLPSGTIIRQLERARSVIPATTTKSKTLKTQFQATWKRITSNDFIVYRVSPNAVAPTARSARHLKMPTRNSTPSR